MRDLGSDGDITVVGGFRSSDPPTTVDGLLDKADVLVDFTTAPASPDILLRAIGAGVRAVSGTSGLTEATLSAVDEAARARGIAAMWAGNYNQCAVLMLYLARIAAKQLGAAEIIEAHGQNKMDSPSGTSLALARAMREARGTDFPDPTVAHHSVAGTRGGIEGGVRIHALRLPADVGWYEVVFSSPTATLTLRQDGYGGREDYVPVVAKAVREVMRPGRIGLMRGAETLFGLDGAAGPVR
jgi:4-hydroxy-tetrahydrodipicolinate reductase